MKKILVSVLAIAGLVACNNENVISVADSRTPITFDGVFVENATRADDPSTTTDNINKFYVWAYMNEVDGTVFEDETVSRSGDKWTYDHISYWMPDNHYYFAAFAGDRTYVEGLTAMDAEGLGEITFTNNEGTNDILYAEYDVLAATTNNPVKFQFAHLLSKVKFTFINGFANENQTIVVKDIQMVAPEVATIDLSADELAWANHSEEVTLDFGDMNGAAKLAIGDRKSSDNERLTIPAPATQGYTITFVVDVYNGNQPGIENRTMTVELNGFEFVAGRAYNLVATINQENLNLDAIEFEVEVDEWIEQEVDGGAVEGEVTFVSTIDELKAILAAATGDTNVVLGADLVATEPVIVPEIADATITINGNGHIFDGCFQINGKSTYANATTIFDNIAFESTNAFDNGFIYCGTINGDTNKRYPDNVTIKRCTFKAAATVPAAKFWSLNGNLVVEDCKVANMHSMLQLTSCGEANVVIEGVEVVNCKNGISLGDAGRTVIRKAEINAQEYGIRANGSAAYTIIEASKIAANQPVVVRNVTVDGYVLNIDEATELTPAGDYDVIFTAKSDDKPYVAPAKAFTYNGPADLVVFPQTVVVRTAEEIAAALKAETQKINVKLANDIEVAISTIGTTASGDAKQMGGANTEAITIDLNGNKLNLTTTYWSVLGAKNSDAIVTIKNGTMTSSQTTGTWNSYDLSFSNCNYAFEDVVFEKAIALEAANKSYNLKNVTINETHDYYAMWITAEGQNVTIDGLTVNSLGRGIKIDEQYVDAPAKVTLNIADATFTTANKAAILVKSVAGAEINVENIDIANVAKDTEFAVWVDEDAAAYADLVVVNGALVKVEGAKDTVASSATELAEAVQNGAKNVYLENGTYTLASYPAGLKLVGCGDNVVFDATGKKYGVNGDVTIENVEVRFANANYTGFQHTNVEVYKNCTIVGQPFLYGNDITFEGCTFEQDSANAYNVWTYGAKNVKFVDCVFNCAGKSVLIYTESGNGQNASFEGCTFNASAPADGKAAIEIDSSLINGEFNVVINDCEVNGFANGSVSGNSLWNNKKGTKTNIIVDGVEVL